MKKMQIKRWFALAAATAVLGTAGCGSTAVYTGMIAKNIQTKDTAEDVQPENAEEDVQPENTAGSASEEKETADGSGTGTTYTPATIAAIDMLDLTDMFSDKDLDDTWNASEAASITLEGTSVKTSGNGVTAEGTTVTITEGGTYVVSGKLDDGQIIVEAPEEDKVKLVLNGVMMTNDDSACIFVKSADKVILTLAEGTENTLSDTGEEFVQPDEGSTVDAVIFSRDDLSLNGSGTLTVNAGTEHGIVCKDDLVVTGGSYTITAAGKGLTGKDSLRIKDGTFAITAEDDAVHSSTEDEEGKGYIYIEGGTFTLSTGDDGIHAATALIIAGGDITVTESREGLEGATIDILDGNLDVTASDDGLNAAWSSSGAGTASMWENGGSGWAREGENFPENGEMWGGKHQNSWNSSGEWETQAYAGDISDEEWEEMLENNGFSDEEWEEMMEYYEEYMRGGDAEMPAGGEGMTPPELPEGEEGMTPPEIPAGEEGMTPPELPEGEEGMMQQGRNGRMGGGMRPDGGFGGEEMGGMQNGAGGFGMMDAQEGANLRITGGTIYVNAGGDGLDANGYIYIEGGDIQVDGPVNEGNGAIDCGIGAVITGGTIVASGSASMAESFGSGSTQYSFSHTFAQNISGGTPVILKDADGKEIVSVTPAKDYRNVVISTPDLQEGTYTISAGSLSETVTISGSLT